MDWITPKTDISQTDRHLTGRQTDISQADRHFTGRQTPHRQTDISQKDRQTPQAHNITLSQARLSSSNQQQCNSGP